MHAVHCASGPAYRPARRIRTAAARTASAAPRRTAHRPLLVRLACVSDGCRFGSCSIVRTQAVHLSASRVYMYSGTAPPGASTRPKYTRGESHRSQLEERRAVHVGRVPLLQCGLWCGVHCGCAATCHGRHVRVWADVCVVLLGGSCADLVHAPTSLCDHHAQDRKQHEADGVTLPAADRVDAHVADASLVPQEDRMDAESRTRCRCFGKQHQRPNVRRMASKPHARHRRQHVKDGVDE